MAVGGVVDDAEVVEAMHHGCNADAVEVADADEFVEEDGGSGLVDATQDAGFGNEHGSGKAIAEAFGVGLLHFHVVWQRGEAGKVGLVAFCIVGAQGAEQVACFVEGREAFAFGGGVRLAVDDNHGYFLVDKGGDAVDEPGVHIHLEEVDAVVLQEFVYGMDGLQTYIPFLTQQYGSSFDIAVVVQDDGLQGISERGGCRGGAGRQRVEILLYGVLHFGFDVLSLLGGYFFFVTEGECANPGCLPEEEAHWHVAGVGNGL